MCQATMVPFTGMVMRRSQMSFPSMSSVHRWETVAVTMSPLCHRHLPTPDGQPSSQGSGEPSSTPVRVRVTAISPIPVKTAKDNEATKQSYYRGNVDG